MNGKKSRVILIEGMSGSGKSTLAQNIWFSSIGSGDNYEWFHEEESDHPIYSDKLLDYLANDNSTGFLEAIHSNWKKIISRGGNRSLIFEGQIILSYLAPLVWFNTPKNIIVEKSAYLIKLVGEYVHSIILLDSKNPGDIIKNTISNRGSNWRDSYFNDFNNSDYAKSNGIKNLDGLTQFWTEVYDIYNMLTKDFSSKTKRIDISNQHWDLYYRDISDFLKLKIPNKPTLSYFNSLDTYCGRYVMDKRVIEVYKMDNELYCNFGWPNLQLIPSFEPTDEFYIKGFPHRLKFNITRGEIVITGKDIAGLRGMTFTKSI